MIRKILILVFVTGISINAFAQFTPKVDSGYKKMDYFHLEASWLGWVNKPDSVKSNFTSHNFSFYFTYPMQMGKSKFSFVPGIGLSIDNVYTNTLPKMNKARDTMWLSPITQSYKMSKETYTYLMIPVSFLYNSKGNTKAWKASLGLRFSYLMQSHIKYNGNDATNTYNEKYKMYDIPFANRYRLDASFTIGYDWIYLVGSYGFTTYIANVKGPQFTPLTIGVGMVGF